MWAQILFLGLISTGGVVFASKRRFEEMLPLTISAIVCFLFLFGLGGALHIGFVILIITTCVAWVVSFALMYIKKTYRTCAKNFFTPAFFAILLIYIVLSCVYKGQMASWNDEFSHWVDIVKVLVYYNDFGTNSAAHSMFATYPPGMALFQYCLQKLNIMLTGSDISEWRIYFARHVFWIAFLFPLMRGAHGKKFLLRVIYIIAFFAVPLPFFTYIYNNAVVDPALGILFAAGFVAIFSWRNKDAYYSTYILAICCMLVLLKDSGMLFAFFLGMSYVVDRVIQMPDGERKSKYILRVAIPVILALLAPKLLWNLKISLDGAVMSGTPWEQITISKIVKLILKQDHSYKAQIWPLFYTWLGSVGVGADIAVGNSGFKFNHINVFVVMVVVMIALLRIYRKKEPEYYRQRKALLILYFVFFAVYVIGLLAMYTFKVMEYEAVRLASLGRYINTIYLPFCLIIIFLSLELAKRYSEMSWKIEAVVICVLALSTPFDEVNHFLDGTNVNESIAFRTPYQKVAEPILQITKNSKIYIISQGTTGFNYCILKYSLRPNDVNEFNTSSIGQAVDDSDIWTMEKTVAEWREELLEEYDYVLLYEINDYFLSEFGSLFENLDDIANSTFFVINKETKLLEKVQLD